MPCSPAEVHAGGSYPVRRLGIGYYQVDFPGLGLPGGTVQVTSAAPHGAPAGEMCQVQGWYVFNTTQRVLVRAPGSPPAPAVACRGETQCG